MTLLEIAQRIDKSDSNASEIDFTNLAKEFNIPELIGFSDDQDRLKAYCIMNHYANSSSLDDIMYFLDDNPVGVSTAWEEGFKWFDKESALIINKYCRSLVKSNKQYRFIDINTEYPNTYTFKSISLRSTNDCIVNGKPAEIVMVYDDDCDIMLHDGTIIPLKNKDVQFKIHVTEDGDYE